MNRDMRRWVIRVKKKKKASPQSILCRVILVEIFRMHINTQSGLNIDQKKNLFLPDGISRLAGISKAYYYY